MSEDYLLHWSHVYDPDQHFATFSTLGDAQRLLAALLDTDQHGGYRCVLVRVDNVVTDIRTPFGE